MIDSVNPTKTTPRWRAVLSMFGSKNLLSRRFILIVLDRHSIWILLAIVMIGAAILAPGFLIPANLLNILVASAFLGCLVLAQSFVLISGHFDLSTEANMVFAAIVGALIMIPPAHLTSFTGERVTAGGYGMAWPLALAVILIAASGVGLLNGLMVARLRMNAFMVTLSMSLVLGGLALVVSQSRRLVGVPDDFRVVGTQSIVGVPLAVIFLGIVALAVHWVLTRSVFGRRLYAVGSNRRAARAAGINDTNVIVSAFVVSGFLSGLAAFLLLGRLGTASAGLSTGALFVSFAAAVIGGVSLFGGRGSVPGMLGGLVLMATITNALNLAAIPSEDVGVATGAAILLAVFVDAMRARRTAANSR